MSTLLPRTDAEPILNGRWMTDIIGRDACMLLSMEVNGHVER